MLHSLYNKRPKIVPIWKSCWFTVHAGIHLLFVSPLVSCHEDRLQGYFSWTLEGDKLQNVFLTSKGWWFFSYALGYVSLILLRFRDALIAREWDGTRRGRITASCCQINSESQFIKAVRDDLFKLMSKPLDECRSWVFVCLFVRRRINMCFVKDFVGVVAFYTIMYVSSNSMNM